MKKILLINAFSFVFLFSLILVSGSVKSQSEMTKFLNAGVKDANVLLEAYLQPFGHSFGATMNNGWFNTAKPHKIVGFDLTFGIQAVSVPTDMQSYNFSDLDLQKLKLLNSSDDPMAPTMFGKDKPGSEVGVFVDNPMNPGTDTLLTSFKLPQGMGYSFFGMPSLQLKIGLMFKTDIAIRYVPQTSLPFQNTVSGKIGLWGIGLMHDISQYIPVVDELPFDLSLQGAYSKFEFNVDFPQALLPDTDAYYDNGTKPDMLLYKDQSFNYSMTAYNLNLIISKKLSVLTVYGAVGYDFTSGNLKLNGKYPIPVKIESDVNKPYFGKTVVADFPDPVDIQMNYNSPKVTLGFRLKFAIFTLHADASYAKYPTANLGIGLSVR